LTGQQAVACMAKFDNRFLFRLRTTMIFGGHSIETAE
jgi:hypothetical protein